MRLFFFFIITVSILTSCSRNKFDVDVSDININLEIHRFDQDLFSINIDSIYNEIPAISDKYGAFFDIFTNRIINIGGIENRALPDRLKLFLEDIINKEVYEYTQKKFHDFDIYKQELTEAFKHYKYYFPEKPIPQIYIYVSRFNQSIVTDENILGIGIDKYLGSNCDYYTALGLPQYMKYKMKKEMIVVDCMKAWGQTEFDFNHIESNMLGHILYKAKIQYFINAMLPYAEDTLKWGFTKKQLDWCYENEKNIWMYLIDNKLLFSTDYKQIKRFTEDGPFTTSFTNESPARAAVWMGLRIIESYLKNNPEITFQELMNEQDYQKILNNSKYEP